MFWICIAWYLVGVAIILIGMKLIDGYVSLGTLIIALTGGGIIGPLALMPLLFIIVTDSKAFDKKLF